MRWTNVQIGRLDYVRVIKHQNKPPDLFYKEWRETRQQQSVCWCGATMATQQCCQEVLRQFSFAEVKNQKVLDNLVLEHKGERA
jgi:hypothetical protein